ncbi:MAG: energy-coupling factor transporter ATPase [Erysipelotrichaceae bacterium]|nr:energy-coupling factor transporter ATPase [Erysipelotrichaceae bacterium]
MSIACKGLGHTYSPNTPMSFVALKDINLSIDDTKITAIIGATGSGKSTLIQHLNALLLPTEGTLEICGRVIEAGVKPKSLKSLRKQVGLVFQFPEYQLFEETVLDDVAFGPKNFGVNKDDAEASARYCLQLVGIQPSDYNKSPLELSGGQKRRAAIAGILALDPSILVLDEPTAGLDPAGVKRLMKLFYNYNRQHKKGVLMVTHDMEQVLNFCDDVVVLDHGQVLSYTSVKEFFLDTTLLNQLALPLPPVVDLIERLRKAGFAVKTDSLELDAVLEAVRRELKR